MAERSSLTPCSRIWRKVVTDKDLAAKLVAGGRASYEAQFTKAVFQRDSLALYEKIAAHAGPFGG